MPPDVSLVLDFLNTLDVEEDVDTLASAGRWHAWTHERELPADPPDEVRPVRDALRAAVGDPAARPGPARAAVEVALTERGPELVTSSAVGAVLAAAARLAVLGEWERVKICPADNCHWAFYDRSRNRSRTWCSMKVCGNREKARAFRERTAAEPPER
ncbi:CGNR zinc finger domain-containing protein [Qaidamihabitans albus]|uniref:CGNR zinc finger domain-containing protein n=1 Tax=Qaidamihabitans albus TaxID=2795733 RepID=UPI0018F11DAF|nr:CGNR zinc finger domain-containing protein [Qaidamihabitans albus]